MIEVCFCNLQSWRGATTPIFVRESAHLCEVRRISARYDASLRGKTRWSTKSSNRAEGAFEFHGRRKSGPRVNLRVNLRYVPKWYKMVINRCAIYDSSCIFNRGASFKTAARIESVGQFLGPSFPSKSGGILLPGHYFRRFKEFVNLKKVSSSSRHHVLLG